MSELHFIYENDKVYAIREGKVIASADNLAELEQKVGFGEPGFGERDPYGHASEGVCPDCGATTFGDVCSNPECAQSWTDSNILHPSEYGGPRDPQAQHSGGDPQEQGHSPWNMQASTDATHVITPGGLKGKILSKTRDVWGEEIAVRLENGRIAHLRVTEDTKFSIEKTASTKTAAESLTAALEAPFGPDRASLLARMEKLRDIRQEAVTALASRTASYEDAQTLNGIIVASDAERSTLRQAIDALDAQEAEGYGYKPLEYTAGPVGESLGSGEASWLDGVVNDMIAEAEGTDFDAVLKEEPHTLVASLSDGTVADMGSTRHVALNHIRSKVAGIAPERAEEIARQFLTNVEEARKASLAQRKTATHKEASAQEDRYASLPDDILFS